MPSTKEIRPRLMTINRAFTLIEVVIVVSVIAILAAMLLPALSAAQEKARQTVCMNGLHQVGLALDNYVSDYDAYPTVELLADKPWDEREEQVYYLCMFPYKIERLGYMGGLGPDASLMFCPSNASYLRPVYGRYAYNASPDTGLPNVKPEGKTSWLLGCWRMPRPPGAFPSEFAERLRVSRPGGVGEKNAEGLAKKSEDVIPPDVLPLLAPPTQTPHRGSFLYLYSNGRVERKGEPELKYHAD